MKTNRRNFFKHITAGSFGLCLIPALHAENSVSGKFENLSNGTEKVSSFDIRESKLIRQGFESEKLDNKLKGVYFVYYLGSNWVIE